MRGCMAVSGSLKIAYPEKKTEVWLQRIEVWKARHTDLLVLLLACTEPMYVWRWYRRNGLHAKAPHTCLRPIRVAGTWSATRISWDQRKKKQRKYEIEPWRLIQRLQRKNSLIKLIETCLSNRSYIKELWESVVKKISFEELKDKLSSIGEEYSLKR